MAFGTRDVLGVMREQAGDGLADAPLRVDGGASDNGWLMQFQADVLGAPVERPDMIETTALGAAGLAGVTTGIWSSAHEFLARRRFTRFVPGTGVADALAGVAGWHRAVRATLAWARDAG